MDFSKTVCSYSLDSGSWYFLGRLSKFDQSFSTNPDSKLHQYFWDEFLKPVSGSQKMNILALFSASSVIPLIEWMPPPPGRINASGNSQLPGRCVCWGLAGWSGCLLWISSPTKNKNKWWAEHFSNLSVKAKKWGCLRPAGRKPPKTRELVSRLLEHQSHWCPVGTCQYCSLKLWISSHKSQQRIQRLEPSQAGEPDGYLPPHEAGPQRAVSGSRS